MAPLPRHRRPAREDSPVGVDRDAVVEGYQSGRSGPQLASQHHCSTATIYRVLDQAGIPRRHQQPSLTRDDLVDALARGCTTGQVAHAHDLSVSAVCRALRREGL